MQQLLLVLHMLVCVALVVLVLLQQGKGAEMGAAFGSGASQTLFGSQGSGSFLLKITGLCAALFFATSLGLGYLAAHQVKRDPLNNLDNAVINAVTQQSNNAATAPTASNAPANSITAPTEKPQDEIPQITLPGTETPTKKN